MDKMEKRLGFHYFQDYDHYQIRDLEIWVPELASLQASWLVLKASSTAAIPEEFITGLIQAGIQPILHFDFKVNSSVRPEDIRVLLSSYSHWGVKHVIFFDRPNTKAAWTDGSWSQGDLVERFLDRYLPFIRLAEQNSLIPVFPPLEPGGDYWDLSFLKKLLQLVQQRRSFDFSSNFHMAVSSQTFDHALDWGKGGQAHWKTPRPYSKVDLGEEDHIGFNTWQWYSDLVSEVLNVSPKFFLFYYGMSRVAGDKLDTNNSFEQMVDIALALSGDTSNANALPDTVLGCCFWLLSATESDPHGKTSYFDAAGKPKEASIPAYKQKIVQNTKQKQEYAVSSRLAEWIYPIDHYLLLPSYDWGIPENTLDRIRPIIRDARPTIGFSVIEATNARKVTVWNENAAFSEHDIQLLREAGCLVEEQLVNSIGITV